VFLRKLILRNVRAIEHLELSFLREDGSLRPWTILLGENGCGKSTVLRGLALLLAGGDALSELLRPARSGKNGWDPASGWIREGKPECRLAAEVQLGKNTQRLDLTLTAGVGISKLLERNHAALSLIDQHSDAFLTCGYGVSRRLNQATPVQGSERFSPAAGRVATLFYPDALLNPLESWAVDLHYREGAEGLRIIKSTLAGLLPGAEFQDIDRERKELRFDTPDGNVPLSLLSDGFQNVAAWLGDLLYRITDASPKLRNPLQARGLLLLDELDLHLHPAWQRRLMGFLERKLPNFQIIATTHSPLTAHQAGEGELYTLRRDRRSSSPTLHPFPGSPRQLLLHQFLTSPSFGLTTVDSREVEEAKGRYRILRDQGSRTDQEESEFHDLRQRLADLPQWGEASESSDRQAALMHEIREALAKSRER
jgi:hypothetical protein